MTIVQIIAISLQEQRIQKEDGLISMMFEHLPKIGEEQIKDQFNILNQQIIQGQIKNWLNEELQELHEKNPILFHYIAERAQKFAVGAVMVNDPTSVSVSMALEYLLLLKIINAGIGKTVGLKQFTDMMKDWFKGDDLKGLNDIGKDDK